jgi:SnoaL-like domain
MSDEREIQQVFARYTRAVDHRSAKSMSDLFLPDGKVEIFYNNGGSPELLGELAGNEAIGAAVTTMMKPHPPRGWSHHTTHDPIIEVHGDTATLDVHFVVFDINGAENKITPIEAGYYRPILRKVDGRWMMAHHRIYHSLPMLF